MFKRLASACMACALVLPNAVYAHHGLDFILVQTAHLPEKGSAYTFGRLNYVSETESETELEPALLYGATDRVAVELHAHYEKVGSGSFHYESVAPAVHFRVTPADQPFSFGVSAEYAFAHGDESDVADIAAVFGYQHYLWMAAANVLYEKSSGDSGEWGYAAGIRRTLSQRHALGLEVVGSLENDGYSEVMVGYYGEFSDKLTFNAGIGTALDEGPDRAAHLSVIWRFK